MKGIPGILAGLCLTLVTFCGAPAQAAIPERSLVELAAELSGQENQQWPRAREISLTLAGVHRDRGLPEAAFLALVAALDHEAMLNRMAAIEVLAATRAHDDRYDRAVQGLFLALRNEHNHTRSTAVKGLGDLVRQRPLPPAVLDGLLGLAVSDPYMTVRMDALELLAGLDIGETARSELSNALARELIEPTPGLWQNSRGLGQHGGLQDRATAVLSQLHDSPYPTHVVAAWTAQAASYEPDKALDALRSTYERGEMTHQQVEALEGVASRHRRAGEREKVYAMLFREMDVDGIGDALGAFESASDESNRVRAGHALRGQYRGREVPARVADVAARVAVYGSNAELRGLAAGLLSRACCDAGRREGQLIAALNGHPDDGEIHAAILDFYGRDGIEELLVRYASDEDLSVTFRRRIVLELAEQSDDGLSPGAGQVLRDVARFDDDYYLVQYAGDALQSAGMRPPLRVAMMNRDNQSRALAGILLTLIVLNGVAGIVALVSVFKLRLSSSSDRKRVAIRCGMVGGFLVVSAGMLLLLGAGVIGFLGHNSAPSPSATLMWNLPAYAGTMIYVLLTWLLWNRVRRQTG